MHSLLIMYYFIKRISDQENPSIEQFYCRGMLTALWKSSQIRHVLIGDQKSQPVDNVPIVTGRSVRI